MNSWYRIHFSKEDIANHKLKHAKQLFLQAALNLRKESEECLYLLELPEESGIDMWIPPKVSVKAYALLRSYGAIKFDSEPKNILDMKKYP